MHQVDCLSSFVVVYTTEHFKTKVVHHLNVVKNLYVVSYTVVDNAGVLQNVTKVNDVLSACPHPEPTVVVVSIQVVQLVNIERVSFV